MYNSVLGDKLVLTVEKESESLCAVKVISWEEGNVWVIRSHRLFSLVEENDDASRRSGDFIAEGWGENFNAVSHETARAHSQVLFLSTMSVKCSASTVHR